MPFQYIRFTELDAVSSVSISDIIPIVETVTNTNKKINLQDFSDSLPVTTGIKATSAKWVSVYTTTNLNSSNWTTAYDITQTISSRYLSLSGGTITGSISTNSVSAVNIISEAYIARNNIIIADTSTSRIISIQDDGKCITFSNTSPITASIPADLPVGFNAMFIQINTGQLFVSAGPGVTINSDGGKRKINGQHNAASIISYAPNIFNLAGNLTL